MGRDYDSQNEMVIRREEAKLERAKARAKALEANMEETIADLLKKANVKKVLARDAMRATKDPSRREEIFDKAGGGLYKNDREVITGEEDRPWER